jgi:hypothetical protein
MASAQLTLPLSTCPQCPISYLLTWLLSNFPSDQPWTKIMSSTHQIWVPFFISFFWPFCSYLIRLQRLFLSITSQQYLPYQGHSYLIKKKESLCQCCLDITFFRDKLKPVLKKLVLKPILQDIIIIVECLKLVLWLLLQSLNLRSQAKPTDAWGCWPFRRTILSVLSAPAYLQWLPPTYIC